MLNIKVHSKINHCTNLNFKIKNPNPQSEIRNPKFPVHNPHSALRYPQSEIRNSQSTIRTPHSDIRNPKSEIKNQKFQRAFLFSKNAAIPSCPSSEARISAIISAV